MRKTFAILAFFYCFSVHTLYADKKKQEQEYHVYLKTVDGKEKALNLKIPSDFRTGVKYKEDSEGQIIFLSENDPQDNWLLMTEHISFHKVENLDFLTALYVTCMRSGVNKESIPEHTVTVTHEDGIATGTAIFKRSAISYRLPQEAAIGPPKKEFIVFKAFQGDGHVIMMQYIKRYDLKAAAEEEQELKEKADELFRNCISIVDFKGRNKKPDEKVKTIQGTPEYFKKILRMDNQGKNKDKRK